MDLPRTPSFRLDGRVALVTGASSGIGQACAIALAEAGAHVICAARSADRLNASVAAMKEAGWSAEPLILDMSDIAATSAAISDLSRLDIFLNSAGGARHSPALETTSDDFDAVSDLNWKAAHFASAAAARKMIEGERGGSVVNISSQMGHVGGIDRTVYAASKHAIEGMTKSMAIEWGPHGIRVNSISPTFIRTPMTEPTFGNEERVEWIKTKIKLGRVGKVEDIMGAAVFLASDASALVTGTTVLVDGGWTAG